MSSIIHATAHGLIADDPFRFANLVPADAGPDEDTIYYVLASGLTADDFEFSDSIGGTPFTLTLPITDGNLVGPDGYTVEDGAIMTPPDPPDPPTDLTLTSAVALDRDGHAVVRLDIELTQPTSATLRHSVVIVTGPAGDPVQVIIPVGSSTASIMGVIGGADYNATANAFDTFGNISDTVVASTHTTAIDTTAPSAPTSPAASAGILSAILSWVGVSAADLSHYELAQSTDGGSTFPTVYKVKTTINALTGLTAGTAYVWKVRAVDLSGNASAYTSTVTATPRKVTGSGLSGADIEALSIGGADIKANTITAAKIAAGTITSNEIAADTITAGNIAADAITSSEIAANAVTASEIAANAVTAAKILAGEIGTTHFSATATISLVSNTGATVVIDATGITIANGKLFLQDYAGNSVLGAAGFAGSWISFLNAGGIYNAGPEVGVVNTDLAVTEVSGAHSIANYAASLGTQLPYWVIAASDTTFTRQTSNALAVIGNHLRSESTGSAQVTRWYQDLPVSGEQCSGIWRSPIWAGDIPTGTLTFQTYLTFLDANHTAVSGGARAAASSQVMAATQYETSPAAVAGNAAGDTITVGGTGLSTYYAVDTPIRFVSITGGAGLVVGTTYYVIAANKVSLTLGGAAVNFTTDITAGNIHNMGAMSDENLYTTINGAFPGLAYVRVEMEVTHSATGSIALFQGPEFDKSIYTNAGFFTTLSAVDINATDALDVNGNATIGGYLDTTTGKMRGGGTTMPGSPAADDRYYRTDLDMWFAYDGTRWLSVDVFEWDIDVSPGFGASWPFSATAANSMRNAVPFRKGGTDIYLLKSHCTFFVNSGGTALGASHKWVGVLSKAVANNTLTTLITVNINSGSSAAWRVDDQDINALLDNGTVNYEFAITWTKTGTPGTLVPHWSITYRIVAT